MVLDGGLAALKQFDQGIGGGCPDLIHRLLNRR
jgi:hypothetical protein